MNKIETFLRESNAIERVYDEQSLKDAKKAWTYLASVRTMDKDVVLKTHRLLMVNQDLQDKYMGAYRDCDVWIGGRKGANPASVPHKMEDWIKTMNSPCAGDPEERSKELHVQYEKIHGFIDGNGRTGRMFMNWWRKRNGLEIMIVYEKTKHDYYQWFHE